MLRAADEPAIRSRIHRIDLDAYHRLGEAGLIPERTELIREVLIEQEPKPPLHTTIVQKLGRYLRGVLPAGYHLRSEQPLTLSDSETEPDIAVVAGEIEDYDHAHPTTAALLVEACVTSEDLDRVKLGVYADASIAEVWLVLTNQRLLERHTNPSAGVYRDVEKITFPTTLGSTVFSSVALPPKELFPA